MLMQMMCDTGMEERGCTGYCNSLSRKKWEKYQLNAEDCEDEESQPRVRELL